LALRPDHEAGLELWQARAEDLQEAASGQGAYVLWLLLNEHAYPHADAVRRALVGDWRGLLFSQWIARGLPLVDLGYYLSRPGQLALTAIQATHEQDQAEAMVADHGGAAVIISLTNAAAASLTATGTERF
jgi:hypothetical protein